MVPAPRFHYEARVPTGFARATPGADGTWQLGPHTVYTPLPHQLEHYATPTSDAQVRVFALAAAPFVDREADPIAWATAVGAAVGDDLARGPWGGGEPDPRDPAPAAVVCDCPDGRAVLSAERTWTALGAIDRYTWVAERGAEVYVVRLQVTGVRPVARVAGWLVAFATAPFGATCDPAWVWPEAPPLRAWPPPRDNQ